MSPVLSSRIVPAVIAAGLAVGVGGGYALASGGPASVIHACVRKGTHAFYAGKCKAGDARLSWNRTGPSGPPGATGTAGAAGTPGSPGPSGVVNMTEFDATGYPTNTSGAWAFVSQAQRVAFDAKTAVQVTGTVDFGSTNTFATSSLFAVCDEPIGGTTLAESSDVGVNLPAAAAGTQIPVTVSGVVSDLTPGSYAVGLCTKSESANTVHGYGTVTLMTTELP